MEPAVNYHFGHPLERLRERYFLPEATAAALDPVLEKTVRAWIAAKWPFKKVAFPGRDMPLSEWNSLPNRSWS